MADVFRRPSLAAELASRLLRPGVLDEGLRSGLFLSGLRRTGKTTFLRTDLVPELEDQGALVIYVDLWSDTKASPAALVQTAVPPDAGPAGDPLLSAAGPAPPDQGPGFGRHGLPLWISAGAAR